MSDVMDLTPRLRALKREGELRAAAIAPSKPVLTEIMRQVQALGWAACKGAHVEVDKLADRAIRAALEAMGLNPPSGDSTESICVMGLPIEVVDGIRPPRVVTA